MRVLLSLAGSKEGEYVAMKGIAEKEGISLKYLERILPVLTQNGIIEGVQGKGGGYRLTRAPEEYTVGEILRLTEGDLAPVSCLESGASPCEKSEKCKTRPLWTGLYGVICEYLDGVTLAELLNEKTV